jgi:hypothetical protein
MDRRSVARFSWGVASNQVLKTLPFKKLNGFRFRQNRLSERQMRLPDNFAFKEKELSGGEQSCAPSLVVLEAVLRAAQGPLTL